MPTITLSRKEIEKEIGKKISLEELKDRISMLGTDLEKIEGDEIVVEIFPNRPDMLSEQGFSRALSSFLGIKKGIRNYVVRKGGNNYKVKVEDIVKNVRPYTACAIIKGLKLDDEKIKEIIQIQEKLHITFGRNRKKLAIGIYPLENISLPITYTAKKPLNIQFQPLESKSIMNGLQILSKHATGREYRHLLEGKDVFPVFIDSKGNILSMPPIINSHKTGRIIESTEEVFVECSGFDYDYLSKCLNILVTTLADMGGEVYSMEIEYNKKKIISPDLRPEEMKFDILYVNKILGLKLGENEIKELLAKMGIGYSKGNALIPCYRSDILHQIDIAEDIAIAYGYENFVPEIPQVSTIGEEDKFEIFKDRILNILSSLGLLETISYNLTNKLINNKKMLVDGEIIKLENSLNIDYSCLRSWLLPSLMKILSENTHKGYPQRLFESGKVFNLDKNKETGVREEIGLSVVLCGANSDFTKIRQVLDSIMKALDIEYAVKENTHPSFIDGRFGVVNTSKEEFAFIGEIKPKVLDNFSLEMPTVALEINLGKLFLIFNNNKD